MMIIKLIMFSHQQYNQQNKTSKKYKIPDRCKLSKIIKANKNKIIYKPSNL